MAPLHTPSDMFPLPLSYFCFGNEDFFFSEEKEEEDDLVDSI
jgi:hypothetical protein